MLRISVFPSVTDADTRGMEGFRTAFRPSLGLFCPIFTTYNHVCPPKPVHRHKPHKGAKSAQSGPHSRQEPTR